MSKFKEKLLEVIASAKHAVAMTVCSEVCDSILDACNAALERGAAVELYLDPRNRATLEKSPFLLHKCLQLINKGGSVSLTEPCTEARWYLCMTDFAEVRDIAADRMVTYREEKNQVDIQNIARDFRMLAQNSQPYLAEPGDIRIHLSVSEHVLMKGDEVTVTWEVDTADRIVIQGIGEVEAYGSRRLKIDRHTIIRLGAYNERQSQIKAVKIWVSEEIKIAYDIGFLSARTNAYTSLVQADNYPHIYGVAHGTAIRLVWQVSEASEVKILPFNITRNKGEHVFTPVQSQQIVIQARIQGKVVTRKIKVLIFPIPVFRDKLVSLNKSMNDRYRFTLPATIRRGLSDDLRQMISRERQRYEGLNSILYRQYFDAALKRINLERVGAFLFSFLKRKYAGRANIVGIIQSIQDYYNAPKHRL